MVSATTTPPSITRTRFKACSTLTRPRVSIASIPGQCARRAAPLRPAGAPGVSGQAAERATVVGDHVADGRPRVEGCAGGSPVELGVGPVQVADDPLRVAEPRERAEINLPGRLQRGQPRRPPVRRRLLDELEVAPDPVEDF